MNTIRVVWGTATGPTEMASYDAALAEANVHNYNLVPVSSVIPADAEVEAVGDAPDLGPAGERLTVVQARATVAGPGRASAGLAWSTSEGGPGLFYEAGGETGVEDVRGRVLEGLSTGQELRDWTFDEAQHEVVTAPAEPGMYTSAVVLAVFGQSDSLFD
jgi:arginine decarboxylase